MRAPALRLVSLVLAAASFSACDEQVEEHIEIPEANVPTSRATERGPVGQALYTQETLAQLAIAPSGRYRTPAFILPDGASRVSAWVSLEPGREAPKLFVQPSWSNGQSGAWLELQTVYTDQGERILSVDLQTVASQVQLELDGIDSIRRIWWAANIPVSPSRRAPQPELETGASSFAPRSSWLARSAMCGEITTDFAGIEVVRIPEPPEGVSDPTYLRALQAFGIDGFGWCDTPFNQVVGSQGGWMGRGNRKAPDAGDQLRMALMRCEADEAATQHLQHALEDLADRNGIPVTAIRQVTSPVCGTSGDWVDAAIEALAVPDPDPTPTVEEVSGRVFEVSSGLGLPGALVSCSCGSSAVTDASGAFRFDLPVGTHTLSVSLGGFDSKLETVDLDGVDTTQLELGLSRPAPTEVSIRGRVYDAASGDFMTGVGIAGASVACTCGAQVTTDATGMWSLIVPIGPQTLQVLATGFVSRTMSVDAVSTTEVIVDVGLQAETPMTPGISVIDSAFLITRFGGTDADPTVFAETEEGFQQYLDAVGVQYFAAWEYLEPNNPTAAANCGYTLLLPEHSFWRKAASLGLLADQLRGLVNEPVTLRNWWRPACYNDAVGGEPNGDHPDGDALDLDFRSARSRADAQRYLCDTYWNQDLVTPDEIAPGSNLDPRLNLSVGLGNVTIHLGLLSRNGRRYWKYDSYTELANSGNCW